MNPPISRQRAWKIVTTAHREAEAAEQKLKMEGLAHFRLLTVYRLERQIRALDSKLPDVNAARMLLKISTLPVTACLPDLSATVCLLTHLALITAATYLDRMLSGTDDAVWR